MVEYEEDLEEFSHAEYLEDNYPDLDPEEAEYVDYMMAMNIPMRITSHFTELIKSDKANYFHPGPDTKE